MKLKTPRSAKRAGTVLFRLAVGSTMVWMMMGLDFLEAWLAPAAEPWARWEVHDAASTERIDHSDWGRFLGAYVAPDGEGVNRIPYARVTPAHRKLLEDYIARMGAISISRFSRGEQFAYWINLYNALTVRLVLDHYPLKSIFDLNISPGWLSFGPWEKKLLEVEDVPLSLGDIEHRILRPSWRDPRIHYVVNCSALGCPNLLAKPFSNENAEAMLDAAARAYVNDPRGARVEAGKLTVSKLYNWFSKDFGTTDAAVIAHLKTFAAPPLLQALDGVGKISGYRYDWALNDASPPPRAEKQ